MNRFYLIKQLPKPSKIKTKGYLSVDPTTKQARFFALGNSATPILEKVEIKFASSQSILLSGFEPTGFDKTGREKYKYQEWVLFFAD